MQITQNQPDTRHIAVVLTRMSHKDLQNSHFCENLYYIETWCDGQELAVLLWEEW
jgi:uncharacterized protein with WD repeat